MRQKQKKLAREEEMKILGGNAQEIITANQNWINKMVSNKVFTEDEEAENFMVLVTMRVVQRFYKKLRGMSGDNTPIPIATSPDPKNVRRRIQTLCTKQNE